MNAVGREFESHLSVYSILTSHQTMVTVIRESQGDALLPRMMRCATVGGGSHDPRIAE